MMDVEGGDTKVGGGGRRRGLLKRHIETDASFNRLDDIEDNSDTRRGQPGQSPCIH